MRKARRRLAIVKTEPRGGCPCPVVWVLLLLTCGVCVGPYQHVWFLSPCPTPGPNRDLIRKLLVTDRTRRLGNMKVSVCIPVCGTVAASHVRFVVKSPPASAGDIRDWSSIPGSGRSPAGGHGNPLQCSWASLVAQLVKNPPAMWETSIQSLGWEDPLEKGKPTHSSVRAWRIPLDRGAWRATVQRGCKESGTTECLSTY